MRVTPISTISFPIKHEIKMIEPITNPVPKPIPELNPQNEKEQTTNKLNIFV